MDTSAPRFNKDVRKHYASKVQHLDDIEKLAGRNQSEIGEISLDWEKEVLAKSQDIITAGDERGQICVGIIKITHQTQYLLLVIDKKCSELGKALIFALNTGNYVALGLSSRSLFEHAASMAYLLNELKSLDEKLGRQHETEKINAMLGAFSKKVEKLYYGTGYFEHATRSLKPIHINELVKSFGNDITDEKKKYAYLCDFVHPNLGVNLLISDGGLGQGRVEPDQTIVSSLIGYILELDGDMARFTDGKEAEFFDFLVFRMKYYCDELLIGSSNINNIFSRNIKKGISGTGVSSKDPITFSNVKSYSQYINALLQFLEDKEIDPLTRRGEYGAKGNNFDVYKKNGRDVWILINWQL